MQPHAFWLFGLSGAGKSTLAAGLVHRLRALGQPVLALDGDALRGGLCLGLGFSDADRAENLRRAAETAKLALASGIPVVASFITPRETHRRQIRAILGLEQVSLIHLNASLEVCQRRDVKGLYADAARGGVPLLTGVSSAFEPPAESDLVLPTATEPADHSLARLCEYVTRRLRIIP